MSLTRDRHEALFPCHPPPCISLPVTASTATATMAFSETSTVTASTTTSTSLSETSRAEASPRHHGSAAVYTPRPNERSLLAPRSPSSSRLPNTPTFSTAPPTLGHWQTHDTVEAKTPIAMPLSATHSLSASSAATTAAHTSLPPSRRLSLVAVSLTTPTDGAADVASASVPLWADRRRSPHEKRPLRHARATSYAAAATSGAAPHAGSVPTDYTHTSAAARDLESTDDALPTYAEQNRLANSPHHHNDGSVSSDLVDAGETPAAPLPGAPTGRHSRRRHTSSATGASAPASPAADARRRGSPKASTSPPPPPPPPLPPPSHSPPPSDDASVSTSGPHRSFAPSPHPTPHTPHHHVCRGTAIAPGLPRFHSPAASHAQPSSPNNGNGHSGVDSANTFVAVNHFSSCVDVLSWPRCSKASSSVSLGFGNVPDVDDDDSSDDRFAGGHDGATPPPAGLRTSANTTPSPHESCLVSAADVRASASALAWAAGEDGRYNNSHRSTSSSSSSSRIPSPPPPSATTVECATATTSGGVAAGGTRHRVRSGSQPVVVSSQLSFTRSGLANFSSPWTAMQRCRSTEDVCGEGPCTHRHGEHRDGVAQGVKLPPRRPGPPPPPPPPPPPSHMPSPMLRAVANISGGFSSPMHAAHGHGRMLSCNTSAHLGISASGSSLASPAPEETHRHAALSSPSLGARGESVLGDEERAASAGRATAFSSKMGSFSSTHITSTSRLSLDELASRLSTPPTLPNSTRGTPIDVAQHTVNHRHGRRSAASTPSQSVPPSACTSPPSLPEGAVLTVMPPACLRRGEVPHVSVSRSDVARTSEQVSHGSSPARAPADSVADSQARAAQRGTSVFVSSSAASLGGVVTCAVSDPTAFSASPGNLAAPTSSNGSHLTWQSPAPPPPPTTTTGSAQQSSSPPRAHDGFVMRPDAETVQGLPRGKVPRMPGCSMRDWAAHLGAKEAELRRREPPAHLGGGGSGASRFAGGAAAATKPASTAAARLARLPRMTAQEVAAHNTRDDLWMVIRNVVYDCTNFQRFHPGGEKLLLACAGRDATAVYDRFHAWVSCESFMAPYAVGVLAAPETH